MIPSRYGSRSHHPPVPESPSPHRRERRAIRIGLVVSATVHLLAIAVYPLVMDQLVPVPAPADPADPEQVHLGMEVLHVLEVPELPEADPEAEPDPAELEPTVAFPEAEPLEPDLEELEIPEPERRPTVAERLRPRLGDPRLWVPMDRELTDLTDQERAELLLRGMIESWNDSMAVAAALAEDARDWTYTDEDGRRWGLSPGRLHLGDFSIPLPFSFQVPPGQRDAWAQQQWQLEDLARAAAAQAVQETWAERAREIRRRMEEERGNRGGDGGPP